MTYAMLLWPHANSRYQEAVRPLALGELRLLLGAAGLAGTPQYRSIAEADWLTFEADALSPRQLALISRHSSAYFLARIEGELLRPVAPRAQGYLGRDLSGILKYKGKTNEAFTRLLINYALASGDFSGAFDQPLNLFDPMCGRGTTLFEALARGYNACGADLSRADIDEGYRFLKKYLEYHRLKHRTRETSLSLPGGKSAPMRSIALAADKEAFVSGDVREVSFICQDAALAARALPANSFHMAVCDLPYGVQHGPAGEGGFDKLLERALPALNRALKPGAALALSFNINTLPAARVREHIVRAGFALCEGEPYEGLAHWVEQAITRDVALGVKLSH